MKTNIKENSIPAEFENLADTTSGKAALRDSARNYFRLNRAVKPALIANDIICCLKREPDPQFGDAFNRLVCTNLDSELLTRASNQSGKSIQDAEENLREELLRNGQKPNVLQWSETVVKERVQQNLTEEDFRRYRDGLRGIGYRNLLTEARSFAERFTSKNDGSLVSDELQTTFEALWALTVIGQPYPLEDRYARSSIKQQIASSTFERRELTVATLVCMSYVHQEESKPGTVRVTPGPIEKRDNRDNDDIEALEKFNRTTRVYETFLGKDQVKAYAILSDIDFVDVFRVSDTEALAAARQYVDQYQERCEGMGLIPLSFMSILDDDPRARDLYGVTKDDIAQNIQRARRSGWRSDPTFYYNAAYIDALTESIFEYYNSLPGISMSWETASQNTVDKLRVYGSQPEVLRLLFPQGYLFVSSETPVRDAMYMPRDKALKKERMAIMYPLTYVRQEE